jgi:hypothetical protein
MLMIPSGQVLFSAGTPEIYAYTPDGAPDEAWRPEIVDCPKTITAGSTFVLNGRQLNGLSQASVYGDDATVATNYPIVRVTTASGHVVFCRTFNHSTLGVATGNTIVQTTVAIPANLENGVAELVVTNGITSNPCEVTVVEGREFRGHRDRRPPRPKAMAEARRGTAVRGPLRPRAPLRCLRLLLRLQLGSAADVLHVVAVLLAVRRVGVGVKCRLYCLDVDLQHRLCRLDVDRQHRLRRLDVDRRDRLQSLYLGHEARVSVGA